MIQKDGNVDHALKNKAYDDIVTLSTELINKKVRVIHVPLSISHGKKDKLTHAGTYGIEVSMKALVRPPIPAPNQNLYVMVPDESTVAQAKEYIKQLENNQKIVITDETIITDNIKSNKYHQLSFNDNSSQQNTLFTCLKQPPIVRPKSNDWRSPQLSSKEGIFYGLYLFILEIINITHVYISRNSINISRIRKLPHISSTCIVIFCSI